MDLKDQVCSLEKAKKLKYLGVKQDSLFWWDVEDSEIYHGTANDINCISAFSCSELGEILAGHPLCIRSGCRGYDLGDKKSIDWSCEAQAILYCEKIEIQFDHTEVEVRAKMLIYLIENNYV